jgi:hypothetical protein
MTTTLRRTLLVGVLVATAAGGVTTVLATAPGAAPHEKAANAILGVPTPDKVCVGYTEKNTQVQRDLCVNAALPSIG